jgi:hypothetical protein
MGYCALVLSIILSSISCTNGEEILFNITETGGFSDFGIEEYVLSSSQIDHKTTDDKQVRKRTLYTLECQSHLTLNLDARIDYRYKDQFYEKVHFSFERKQFESIIIKEKAVVAKVTGISKNELLCGEDSMISFKYPAKIEIGKLVHNPSTSKESNQPGTTKLGISIKTYSPNSLPTEKVYYESDKLQMFSDKNSRMSIYVKKIIDLAQTEDGGYAILEFVYK